MVEPDLLKLLYACTATGHTTYEHRYLEDRYSQYSHSIENGAAVAARGTVPPASRHWVSCVILSDRIASICKNASAGQNDRYASNDFLSMRCALSAGVAFGSVAAGRSGNARYGREREGRSSIVDRYGPSKSRGSVICVLYTSVICVLYTSVMRKA